MTVLCLVLAAVDLFIGTQGLGNVTPAAAYPFGLVQAGPDTSASRCEFKYEKVSGKEDRGFNYDISGCIGQYVHGNEPSHHIAYCYVYTDCPWKTGPVVRRIFDTQYGISPDGLCGNDDCGQMSAWYVFSALGFYPLDPCGGVYVVGAPHVQSRASRLTRGYGVAAGKYGILRSLWGRD